MKLTVFCGAASLFRMARCGVSCPSPRSLMSVIPLSKRPQIDVFDITRREVYLYKYICGSCKGEFVFDLVTPADNVDVTQRGAELHAIFAPNCHLSNFKIMNFDNREITDNRN